VIFLFRMAIVVMVAIPVYILRLEVARAHGEYAFIVKYETRFGQSCCGPVDAVVIPHEVAAPLEVGNKIVIEINDMSVEVVVNIIYPSEDPEGRSWITRYGCLFKMFGV